MESALKRNWRKMKIKESTVRKLTISDIERLDNINVYLEDFEPGHGQITIKCWNEVWSS